jgi:putative aldouronate transport system permease protein
MKLRLTLGDRVFEAVNTVFMVFLMLITLYPMYYVIVASFSSSTSLLQNPGFILFPRDFTMGAYEMALRHPLLIGGFRNTLFIIAVSLPLNITLTLLCGYFMASKGMFFRKPILVFILFTMWFNAGIIPIFLNIQSLGLANNIWSLILPGAMSVFNAIICKTAIEALPGSLIESAYVDGANDLTIVFKIVAPLIMPTIAVLLLFYGVGHWNAWFWATIFIRDNEILPVQNLLRAILIEANQLLLTAGGDDDRTFLYAETVKYAAIAITTIPVLLIYPFLQKYFVKGVMIGAIKG